MFGLVDSCGGHTPLLCLFAFQFLLLSKSFAFPFIVLCMYNGLVIITNEQDNSLFNLHYPSIVGLVTEHTNTLMVGST